MSTLLETDEEPGISERMIASAGWGLGAGVATGTLLGLCESLAIAFGDLDGLGEERQVLWYGPLAYALVTGGLGAMAGVVLGVRAIGRDETRVRTASLTLRALLVPLGLVITILRLYLDRKPPMSVLLGVLAIAGIIAVALGWGGRRIFSSPLGKVAHPLVALGLLGAVSAIGATAALLSNASPAASFPIPAALRDRPNIILVMVDTLRADHISCYGASSVATPNICSLVADGGTRFEAFSQASSTKPATASLLTSLAPSSHKATSKTASLSDEVLLIAEVLQQSGYTTGGIVADESLAERFGFDQGYDQYHYLAPSELAGAKQSSSKLILYQLVRRLLPPHPFGLYASNFYRDSLEVNEVAFDWLDRHTQSRFFLFLHYMDAHDPYFAHPYNGEAIARVSNPNPDPQQATEMRRLYNGEIEHLDRSFGQLLAKLKEQGLYGETVIALVADHGEEFQEHGGWWHGRTLYDEQIRVPLLVKWAKGRRAAPAASNRLARSIDVAPTLIAQAGIEVPAAMQGVDLATPPQHLPAQDRLAFSEQVFSEQAHEGNELWSLRTREWKIIRGPQSSGRGVAERELFAIESDPGEQHNLAGGEHASVEQQLALHAELQRSFALGEAVADSGDGDMTLERCRQLMNLGYVEDCSHIN